MPGLRFSRLFVGTPFLMLLLSLTGSSQKNSECPFQIDHLDFFGLDSSIKPSWTIAEIDELLATTNSYEGNSKMFFLPIIVFQLRNMHPSCSNVAIERRD